MVQIAHASIDERGKVAGGAAGDQTGKEVCIRDYYNKPWDFVIRLKNKSAAKKLKRKMINAAKNNNIGYDQKQRLSFYYALQSVGWSVKAIKRPCECDCSSLVSALLISCGVAVLPYSTTRTLREQIERATDCMVYNAGMFDKEELRRGDILLAEGHHVAVVVSDGGKAVW